MSVVRPSVARGTGSDLITFFCSALAKHHRAPAEAVKATGKGWKLLLVNARMSLAYSDFFFKEPETSVEHVFDERGREVSASAGWISDALDFGDIGSPGGMGMLLPSSDMDDDFSDTWGRCESRITRDVDSDSEEEFYGTTTSIYSATFFLIYDPSITNVELRCLGGCQGVAEVARRVVATRDYGLLERLLLTVEAKEKSKFTISSCIALLGMAMGSAGKKPLGAEIWLNRILHGLSTSVEPNDELFTTILSAVEKYGYESLAAGVSKLLETRIQNSELSVFLRRSDFILKLRKHVSSELGHLEKCLRDLASHGKTRISDCEEVSRMIENMIRQHGWGLMECVVKASLEFMHKVGSKKFGDLMTRFLLLNKFEKARRRRSVIKQVKGVYGFIHACIVDFTKTFVGALLANSHQLSLRYLSGSQKGIFMMAIRWVIEHGRQEELCKFGKFAIKSEEIFSALIKAITPSTCGTSPRAMIREILNKCLVQNTVKGYRVIHSWSVPWDGAGDIPPIPPLSIHVRKILEAYPDMAKDTAENGRLPLHHVAAASGDTFESAMDIFQANPKGASVRDPVSGLYPFMLVASNDHVATSFNLLLADPSLILGGTSNVPIAGASKKRKRSH